MTVAISTRTRIGATAIALALCAACLFVPGDHIAVIGLRCSAVLVILGFAAAWLRGRAAVRATPSPISIVGRCALAKETGVALLKQILTRKKPLSIKPQRLLRWQCSAKVSSHESAIRPRSGVSA